MLCNLTYHHKKNSKLIELRKLNTLTYNVFTFLSSGSRGRVTPSSFPNLEVKPPIADNTCPVWIGNVGRCYFDFLLYFFFPFFFTLNNQLPFYINFTYILFFIIYSFLFFFEFFIYTLFVSTI